MTAPAAPAARRAAASAPSSNPVLPAVLRLRRWWLLLLGVWSALLGGAWALHVQGLDQQAREQTLDGARQIFRMVVLMRTWNALHGGVYVPVSPTTPPNPYLKDEHRDLTSTDGRSLTLLNPAYMTRLLGELAQRTQGAQFHITSLKPINPGNAADAWERSALQTFEQGAREAHTWLPALGAGADRVRYMAPLYVESACLKCHADQGYQLGDVRGGISVSLPLDGPGSHHDTLRNQDTWLYGGVWASVALLGALLLELLRRRWADSLQGAQRLAQSQRALLRAEKQLAVSQLAAGLAHEINNPLAFVRSNFNALRNDADRLMAQRMAQALPAGHPLADPRWDEVARDWVGLFADTQAGLERVQSLVADLMRLAGRDDSAAQPLDLADLVRQAQASLAPRWPAAVGLTLQLGPCPAVHAPPGDLEQVLVALLTNAAQAAGEGPGQVRVTCGSRTQPPSGAWLEVSDDGCGMTPEVQARLFEPFFTTRAVGQGRGLGLAVVHDVLAQQGATIQVQSAPGAGTTVRIDWPSAAPPAP